MSVTTRGVKNAFRNTIRSISITAILALTIALALVMLLSLKAVQARIDDVKASVGNTADGDRRPAPAASRAEVNRSPQPTSRRSRTPRT